MKVFICWSESRSLNLAKELKILLRRIIQALDPWISEVDIQAGERWNHALAAELESAQFGLVCLTPENVKSEWLHFEAGALAKSVEDGRLVPILFGLQPAELGPPLSQFQLILPSRESFEKLFMTLYKALESPQISPDEIKESLNTHWAAFQDEIQEIMSTQDKNPEPVRDEREILEEVLTLVRGIEKRESSTELHDKEKSTLSKEYISPKNNDNNEIKHFIGDFEAAYQKMDDESLKEEYNQLSNSKGDLQEKQSNFLKKIIEKELKRRRSKGF